MVAKKFFKYPYICSAYTWLGIVNLFQTFADLESVKDKQADIQELRQAIDENASTEVESC